jgi:cell division protein FtsI (penicillin-binding protein 3)
VTETGTDHFAGTSGVELYFDRQLAGQDGKVTAMVDARNRIIPGTVKRVEAIDGKSITLTIDSRIQKVAEDELQKTVTTHNGTSGDVVVLDAHDGDILALANFPTYNPNVRNSTTNAAAWDDRAVHDVYEPGSTLKTLTLSAVLAVQGLQMADRHVYCSGEFQVGDHIIHCAKDPPLYGVHGDETMRDVLKNSCNIGAAKFALGLGAPSLFAYEKAFGLLDKPNCGLPFAGYCRLPDPAVTPWRAIRLANVAFGQGIAITALQLSSVYATIANRGQRVYPRICSDIAPQSPPTQVIPGPVADAMLSMLQTVVQQGTGQAAQIGGYSIGGKTGSAQVFDPKLHHYGDNYVGSFCGIVPLSDPKLVILTVVNDPKPVHWGAVVAAPVVHDVAKRALWFMGIKPDSPGTKDYNTKLTPVPR